PRQQRPRLRTLPCIAATRRCDSSLPTGPPVAPHVPTRRRCRRGSPRRGAAGFKRGDTMKAAPSMPRSRRFPLPARRRWRTAARAALLTAFAAGAGAWGFAAQSCCERKACENIRFLNAQIAMNYAMCCQKPAQERGQCLSQTQEKVNTTLGLILTAKQACDNNDDALVR